MERRLKNIQVLIVAISFFILAFPAYFHYCNLSGVDFHSGDPIVEPSDQDDLLIDHLSGSKIFPPNTLSGPFLSNINVFEQLPLIAFQRSSLDQQTLTLRC